MKILFSDRSTAKPLRAIADAVAQEFDVSVEQAQSDLQDFIDQLEAIEAVKTG